MHHLHLDVADAVAFLVDIGRNEVGALDDLQLGGLRGDAAHVRPVLLGGGIDARVEQLDRVTRDAAASALPQPEENDALPAATQLFQEPVGDGVVDCAGVDDGLVVGGELAAAFAG